MNHAYKKVSYFIFPKKKKAHDQNFFHDYLLITALKLKRKKKKLKGNKNLVKKRITRTKILWDTKKKP